MGHLTRIANTVVQNMEKGPMQSQISEFVRGLPEDCRGRWESFVEETLTEANRRNTVDLMSTHHLHSSSEEEDLEAAFPNEVSLQQAFSEYQIQQMTANFVDQFGFNDEEFADQDDNINAPFDRIAEINFNIDADEDGTDIGADHRIDVSAETSTTGLEPAQASLSPCLGRRKFKPLKDQPNASLFEACCNERIQQFDDNEEEEEEDIWEEKEISYATQVKARTRFGVSHSSEGSPRSGLQNGDREDHGNLEGVETKQAPRSATDDNGSPFEQRSSGPSSEGSEWTAVFEPVSGEPAASCVAMDVGSSVWDSAASDLKASEERGWAKFADFQPFCCSEAGPRCSSPVDTESSSDLEASPKQSQDKNFSAASPCAWNVCLARKAPLVASDSSSSGSSDSEEEEEEKAEVVTETLSTGSGQEITQLTVDAQAEEAVLTRCGGPWPQAGEAGSS
uniref:Uncharacterized protein n=1 Tax=Sphaerodactylus townsendi TaxID=933632 RepID=A0ACB8FLM3_9SAUR